jgi:hypothetical protein
MIARVVAPVVVVALAMGAGAAPAQPAVRPTDKQVKQLILDSREAFDRFADKMNPQMRMAVIKSPASEVDVKALLQDVEDMSKDAEQRYRPPAYTAGTEVAAYLKQVKVLDAGLAVRPGLSGADKYWDAARPVFGRLAAAYGIDWNGDPTTWSGRRISDGELKNAATDIKRLAGPFASAIDRAPGATAALDARVRASLVNDATGLAALADEVSKELQAGRDAGPAFGRLSDAMDTIAAAVPASALAGPARTTLETIQARIAVMKRGFGK